MRLGYGRRRGSAPRRASQGRRLIAKRIASRCGEGGRWDSQERSLALHRRGVLVPLSEWFLSQPQGERDHHGDVDSERDQCDDPAEPPEGVLGGQGLFEVARSSHSLELSDL